MELKTKLSILADAAKYDASCASSGSKRARTKDGIGNVTGTGICHSYAPDGRCISLLKVLLTNYCIFDCQFCINRVSSSVQRARFTTEEIVSLTLDFYRRNYIEGLFLSSGIIQSADYTMEQLIAVARSLRLEHRYQGYIHLKLIPGASSPLTEEASKYADRVSANIELPRQADLDQLAPAKRLSSIESSMGALRSLIQESESERKKSRRAPLLAPAGQSTQMIVGATSATDRDILTKASTLYRSYSLRRVYYSAFSPIPDASPALPPTAAPLFREHRLYQSDWLLRFYGFKTEEITPEEEPNLPLDIDPKLHWALRNRERFPVDINRAERAMLLRVPGLGVRTVLRVLQARRYTRLRFDDLARMRVPLSRAKYFITTADSDISASRKGAGLLDSSQLLTILRPKLRHQQLSLFEGFADAVSVRRSAELGEL